MSSRQTPETVSSSSSSSASATSSCVRKPASWPWRINARTSAKDQEGLIIPVCRNNLCGSFVQLHHEDSPGIDSFEEGREYCEGFRRTQQEKVGTVTQKQVEDIARLKLPDLNAASLDAAVRTVKGTARSMGMEVSGLIMAKMVEKNTKPRRSKSSSARTPLRRDGHAEEGSFREVQRDRRSAHAAGCDPKHADQMVRGTVVLPHGLGKSNKVW